jgi:hypothetical protein
VVLIITHLCCLKISVIHKIKKRKRRKVDTNVVFFMWCVARAGGMVEGRGR